MRMALLLLSSYVWQRRVAGVRSLERREQALLAARWAAGPGARPTSVDHDRLLRAAKDGRLPGAPSYEPRRPLIAG